MKTALITLLLLCFIILAVPFACQHIEEPSRHYKKYSPELHNGMWVPDIFPRDIINISEQHDIDTNEVWLKFDATLTKMNLSNYSILSAKQKETIDIRKPFMTSWWFEGIIEQQPSNDNALYSDIYYFGKCGKDMISYIAISKINTTYYWWCQSE